MERLGYIMVGWCLLATSYVLDFKGYPQLSIPFALLAMLLFIRDIMKGFNREE